MKFVPSLGFAILICLLQSTTTAIDCLPVFNVNTSNYEGGYEYALNATADGTGCICRKNLRWDSTNLKCVVDCANLPYATGRVLGDYECECIEGTLWSLYHFRCYMDCRRIPNAVFSQRYRMCVPNCNAIDYAYGTPYITTTGVRCHCQTGFKWVWESSICMDTSSQTL